MLARLAQCRVRPARRLDRAGSAGSRAVENVERVGDASRKSPLASASLKVELSRRCLDPRLRRAVDGSARAPRVRLIASAHAGFRFKPRNI